MAAGEQLSLTEEWLAIERPNIDGALDSVVGECRAVNLEDEVGIHDVMARGLWQFARRPTLLTYRMFELVLAHARDLSTAGEQRIITVPYQSIKNIFPSVYTDDHIKESINKREQSTLLSLQIFFDPEQPVYDSDGQLCHTGAVLREANAATTKNDVSIGLNVFAGIYADNGAIYVELSPRIMPLMARIGEVYDWPKTWHRLRSVAKFSSPYHFQLYSWLLTYAGSVLDVSIEQLRRKLRLDAENPREKDIFLRPGDLMAKVVHPTVEKLNRESDLRVRVEIRRGPRSQIIGVRFHIARCAEVTTEPLPLAAIELLIRARINKAVAERVVSEQGVEYALTRLILQRERVKNGNIGNEAKYLAGLLKRPDLTPALGRDYTPYRDEVLRDMACLVFEGLPSTKRKAMLEEFAPIVQQKKLHTYWRSEGHRHPAIRRSWGSFLLEADILGKLGERLVLA